MFNVGGGEVLVILLIALIVLGPDKLPNAARQAGKYLGDFRRMSNGFKNELRDAMDLGGLSDITDLAKPSTPTKATSPGGPTVQPRADAPTTAAPSADASPVATNGTGSPNGTANAAASANGGGGPGSADGAAPAVRKRSIEVDGPSASFD